MPIIVFGIEYVNGSRLKMYVPLYSDITWHHKGDFNSWK